LNRLSERDGVQAQSNTENLVFWARSEMIGSVDKLKGETNVQEGVVSLLFNFGVVYSIFRVLMVKQCFVHTPYPATNID
jgi:hypothetical protein